MKTHPFAQGDSYATFRQLRERIVQEIQLLDNGYVLNCSVEELETYYVTQAALEPLILHTDRHYIARQETIKIDVSHDFNRGVFPGERAIVPGTEIEIAIPYEGESMLWQVRPSMYTSGCPEIRIEKDWISFKISFPDDTANSEQLKKDINRKIESLSTNVKHLANDLATHVATAKNDIKGALERKRKLAASTVGVVTALGIPMHRREEPSAFVAPAQRRKSPVQRPKAQQTDEPFLANEEYAHILKVLRSMSVVLERNPASLANLEEEAIRTHFLIQLNGHYEGGATGETFNAAGKTDILIRVADKNVFIAECKFWRGPKGFDEAIDQLLSYLSWRDSKTALLVFNKTKDSTAVRNKMHEVILARKEYRKTVVHNADGDSQYIFVNPTDPGKELMIATQLYDFPVPDK